MKIKLFGNVAINVSWSNTIGSLLMYLSMVGAIGYAIFVEGNAGRFIQFVNIPAFILVFGVGIGFTLMRKHTLNDNEIGVALKKDVILGGWIGFMIGVVMLSGSITTVFGPGMGYAVLPLLYGYLISFIRKVIGW